MMSAQLFSSPLREDFEEPSFLVAGENDDFEEGQDPFVDASEDALDIHAGPAEAAAHHHPVLGLRARDSALDSLKKENFNLKLRIFFLEERLDAFAKDIPNAKKGGENILLKLHGEVEALEIELMDEKEHSRHASDALNAANSANENLQAQVLQLAEEAQKYKALADTANAVDSELQKMAFMSEPPAKSEASGQPKLKGVAAIKARITELVTGNQSLEMQVASLTVNVSTLSGELEQANALRATTAKELLKLQQDLAATSRKLVSTAEEVSDLKTNKRTLEESIKDSVATHERMMARLEASQRESDWLRESLKAREMEEELFRVENQQLRQAVEEAKMDDERLQSALEETKAEAKRWQQGLDAKKAHESELQVKIHNLTTELAELRDKFVKSNTSLAEYMNLYKDLQTEVQEAQKHTEKLKVNHADKINALESEIRDLHEQLARNVQERAAEIEEHLARQRARSPSPDLHRLRADHRSEIALYEQKVADCERLGALAARDMAHLRAELDAQTRKLHEIEERWRTERVEVQRGAGAEAEARCARVLEEERALFRGIEREATERCAALQVEVASLRMERTGWENKGKEVEERFAVLHGEVETWKSEVAAVRADRDAILVAAQDMEERYVRILEDERSLFKDLERELSDRCAALQIELTEVKNEMERLQVDDERQFTQQANQYQAEIATLKKEIGRIHETAEQESVKQSAEVMRWKEELHLREQIQTEARDKFAAKNQQAIEKLDLVSKERDELVDLIQELQKERQETAKNTNEHIESFCDILVWINTVMGLPKVDLSQIADIFEVKQRIRQSLEDFQQIRTFFSETVKSLTERFSEQKAHYTQRYEAILQRLKRFEEVLRKASTLQKSLKAQLDANKRGLEQAVSESSAQSSVLEQLRNDLFAAHNDALCTKALLQEAQAALEIRNAALEEERGHVNAHRRELFEVRERVENLERDLQAERDYAAQVVLRFQELEGVEQESRAHIERLEEVMQGAEGREGQYKEMLRREENAIREGRGVVSDLERKVELLEHEIMEVQKVRAGERKLLDVRIHELEEELVMAKRQLEISDRHMRTMKMTVSSLSC
ncbi:hypothetical protein BC830DRAFT_1109854 [Chytriomyces sp. MP71]|nr:hypothetical protein BC830DRAFT_1109854 [Chytriomyces sp. MP71]